MVIKKIKKNIIKIRFALLSLIDLKLKSGFDDRGKYEEQNLYNVSINLINVLT